MFTKVIIFITFGLACWKAFDIGCWIGDKINSSHNDRKANLK